MYSVQPQHHQEPENCAYDTRIASLDCVREYSRNSFVELWRAASGRLVVRLSLEQAHVADLDIIDLLTWIKSKLSATTEVKPDRREQSRRQDLQIWVEEVESALDAGLCRLALSALMGIHHACSATSAHREGFRNEIFDVIFHGEISGIYPNISEVIFTKISSEVRNIFPEVISVSGSGFNRVIISIDDNKESRHNTIEGSALYLNAEKFSRDMLKAIRPYCEHTSLRS